MSVLAAFLESVRPEHRALVRELDAMVRKACPDLIPSLKWGNLTYHLTKNACSIIDHTHDLNLQVWGGAGFTDPQGLLQGTGKGMRHIKFKVGVEFNHAAVVAIIQQAASAARA